MSETAVGLDVEGFLCTALLEATRALPRYRQRTRLSLADETVRRWRAARGAEPADEAITEACEAVIERFLRAGFVKVGGPSDKRIQLTPAGKAHAARRSQ